MQTKHRAFDLDVKEIADNGEFEGYGSVFDVIDSYSEVVAAGAFAESLSNHKAKGTMPALLWQHDARQPIGVWTEMSEDSKGLRVKGKLLLGVAKAREALELMRAKAVRGLSIGFVPTKWQDDAKKGIRTLTAIDLWETSIVTFPANQAAMVEQVRSALARGELSKRLLERTIRDEWGFSATEAKTLLARGFDAAFPERDVQQSAADTEALSSLIHLQNIIKGN